MSRYSTRGTLWSKVRLVVLERDGWHCQIGGPRCLGVATEVDHIVPVEDGGHRLDPANLRAACRPCNAAGGAEVTNRKRAVNRTGVERWWID